MENKEDLEREAKESMNEILLIFRSILFVALISLAIGFIVGVLRVI